jgi:outer membrane PBP1 activator LpoA protein
MRQEILKFALLIGAALSVGLTATGSTSASVPEHSDAAVAKSDKAEAETNGSAKAVQDYAYEQKAALVRNMKKELAKIQRELDRLSVKVENSNGAVKADAKAKLKVVRKKWVQAKNQLDQTASATESTWDEMKDRFRTSYDELKESFAKTRRWLSDKIAP